MAMSSCAVSSCGAGFAGRSTAEGSARSGGGGAAGGDRTSRPGQSLRICDVFLIARAAMPSPKPIMHEALTKLGPQKHS